MTRSGFIFALGLITASCIQGIFEAIDYKPLVEISLPWWLYLYVATVAVVLAGLVGTKRL